MLAAAAANSAVDKEVEAKARAVTEGFSECLHIAVHDPSMALYRVQEHVRKSLPTVVQRKGDVLQMQSALQGATFDVTNAIEVVESMKKASGYFSKIHEQLRTAMYYKQQLDYERLRRERDRAAAVRHSDSTDSLWQELRKSKSLGHLRGSPSDNALTESSIYSHSSTSTPLSEYPEQQFPPSQRRQSSDSSSPRFADLTVKDDDQRSSTPTSGADSPPLSASRQAHETSPNRTDTNSRTPTAERSKRIDSSSTLQ